MAARSWHLLGAGSVGTLWACRLARAGLPVRLILRSASRLEQYLQGPGLRLIENGHAFTTALPAETAAAATPIERLLVTCKAYDVAAAVAGVRQRLVPGATVVLLQNGLGSQQAVSEALPEARVVYGSTTEGAWCQADGSVVFAGQGFTWLGRPGDAQAPDWLADLAQAGIPHQWTPHILGRLWRKLAVNCAINPLTVLHQCRNGALNDHAEAVDALCAELTALLQAEGQAEAAEGLALEVERIVTATAANYSSMYQDVTAGRRTEIAYLISYACARAATLGLALPRLEALHHRLIDYLASRHLPTN
ncbi:putative 2-dehydropantoate 2-reductase [Pseudomonas sp. DC3000-4b1]|uniref:putative 2-dehydropantoate 2-reductase n=1 Tax=unclassified Pseudomonas TaxID=196821 RepID=UPI003CFB7559